jgi:hypothetical protein
VRVRLANYLRAAIILLGAVLMGIVALVVGPTQVSWHATRFVFFLLMVLAAVLTMRFMPIRLPGEAEDGGDETRSGGDANPRTAIVVAATLAGGAAAPLLAGSGAFFFLLAIVSGWLFGLSAKVVSRSRRRSEGVADTSQ